MFKIFPFNPGAFVDEHLNHICLGKGGRDYSEDWSRGLVLCRQRSVHGTMEDDAVAGAGSM